jgi:hypothetical protein
MKPLCGTKSGRPPCGETWRFPSGKTTENTGFWISFLTLYTIRLLAGLFRDANDGRPLWQKMRGKNIRTEIEQEVREVTEKTESTKSWKVEK